MASSLDTGERLARRLLRARALADRLEVAVFDADALNPQLRPAVELAAVVFPGVAHHWWSSPAFGLAGATPRSVAIESIEGRDRVMVLLHRIDWNVAI